MSWIPYIRLLACYMVFVVGMLFGDALIYAIRGSEYFIVTEVGRSAVEVMVIAITIGFPAFLLGVGVFFSIGYAAEPSRVIVPKVSFGWAFATGFIVAILFAFDYFAGQPVTDRWLATLLVGGWLPTMLSALAWGLLSNMIAARSSMGKQ